MFPEILRFTASLHQAKYLLFGCSMPASVICATLMAISCWYCCMYYCFPAYICFYCMLLSYTYLESFLTVIMNFILVVNWGNFILVLQIILLLKYKSECWIFTSHCGYLCWSKEYKYFIQIIQHNDQLCWWITTIRMWNKMPYLIGTMTKAAKIKFWM